VVWADKRTYSSTEYDIYGARVSATGEVLDPTGIPICTDPGRQTSPRVAFDGERYLVVWEDDRESTSAFQLYQIYGARVSATGAVANITASRVGTEKIRKMRFFQPRDYVAVDYTTNHASISNLAPSTIGPWPGVQTRILEVQDIEPLRAEIESFLQAAADSSQPLVSGEDGRRALALALRTLQQIHDHTVQSGVSAFLHKA